MKHKILFIIQSYPSERSANVLCDEKIMMELKKKGDYEIHCLTYQYDRQPMEQAINGFHIHRFKKSMFWDMYTWARHNTDTKRAKLILKLNRVGLRLKQALTIPIYPCYEPINSFLYARAAIKLNKKEHFDLIFAEHNGFDTLYAGHRLKKAVGDDIKFIATLWDPFTGKQDAKYLPHRYCQYKMTQCEAKLLGNADAIIVMKSSENYHKLHSQRKPYYNKIKYFDIPGIIQPVKVEYADHFTKPAMINLLYAGLLSLPNRDPSYLINSINRSSFARNVHLIFLCSGSGIECIERLRKTFKGEITVHSYVDKNELNSVMNNVQGFLNIGGVNSNMVPSKIFEYMSYGKLILSTYKDELDASKHYLEKYPLGLCINEKNDYENSFKEIDKFFKANVNKTVPFPVVETLFPNNTTKPYVKLIECLLNPKYGRGKAL